MNRQYPRLVLRDSSFRSNARETISRCAACGIQVCGVIKGVNLNNYRTIMSRLGRGVTYWEGKGAYTESDMRAASGNAASRSWEPVVWSRWSAAARRASPAPIC